MVKEMEISHGNENTVKDKLTVTVSSSKVSCEEAKFGDPPPKCNQVMIWLEIWEFYTVLYITAFQLTFC